MKTTGDRFTCDRCGREAFLTPTDVNRREWHDVERQSTQGRTERLYCERCYGDYVALLTRQDTEFTAFEAEGRKAGGAE